MKILTIVLLNVLCKGEVFVQQLHSMMPQVLTVIRFCFVLLSLYGSLQSLEYCPTGCFPEPVIFNTQAIQCSSKMGTKEAVQEHGSCCQFMSYAIPVP